MHARRFAKTEAPVTDLAWMRGGELLVGIERFGRLTLWDADSAAVCWSGEATGHTPYRLASHPSGEGFATLSSTIGGHPGQLWTLMGQKLRPTPLPDSAQFHEAGTYTPDGG